MDENEEKEIKQLFLQAEEALNKLNEFHGKPYIYYSEILDNGQLPVCSFCGENYNQVQHMIKGNNAYICNGCVTLCQNLFSKL